MEKWVIGKPDANTCKQLAELTGVSPLSAAVLVSRGIDTAEKAREFFGEVDNNRFAFGDPFDIPDMDKAVAATAEAIDNGSRICIYGDYDCDGVTASAVMFDYLTNMGADVFVHINERDDGFGMNTDIIKRLADEGTEFIITVDNGISCIEEAKLCKELGITLVITDHHEPGNELPDAAAVVDARRADCTASYKNFCGCGLALKFIAAMEHGDMEIPLTQYSPLAAVATVADVVPITGENREIVRRGLHDLEFTENEGLRALIAAAKLTPPFDARAAAFGIAPRINASGRIGSPMDAFHLLTAEDADEAAELAEKICELNTQRKTIENTITGEVLSAVTKDPSLMRKRVSVFAGDGWHHGVIGIAAARCAETLGKPAFLMTREKDGSLRGSARAVGDFNVFGALSHCAELLDRFGGHKGAGGFSLAYENLQAFDDKLQEYAAGMAVPRDEIQVSAVIDIGMLTPDNVAGLEELAPFGEENPRPVFMLAGCTVTDIISLSEGKHTKLILKCGERSAAGLMFGVTPQQVPCSAGDKVNVLVSPSISEYGGKSTVKLTVTDIRVSGINQQQLFASEDIYYAFLRGDRTDRELYDAIRPDRQELVAVYGAVKKSPAPVMTVYSRVMGRKMNFCKLLLCIDIFSEAGLMTFDRISGQVSIIEGAPKADLTQTSLMKRLGG